MTGHGTQGPHRGDDDETRVLPTDDNTGVSPTAPTPTDQLSAEEATPMPADTATDARTHDDPAHRPFAEIPTPSPTFPDRPLDEPLPYGTGFTAGQSAGVQPLGYGVAPETAPAATGSTAVATRERAGSPVLAVAGLLSMGVAVWAIVGAPAISTVVMLSAALVVAVLVGLLMVVRR